MLENVRDYASAKDIWKAIIDVFVKDTLLNKLSTRWNLYSAKLLESEDVFMFAFRVRYLDSTLESMRVQINDEEMAMALLNGLTERFDSLISALDAFGDENKFSFEFMRVQLLQEEQRNLKNMAETLKRS